MSSNNLTKTDFHSFFSEWLDLKKKAIQFNNDIHWEMYLFFLKEAKISLSKVYVNMKNERWIEVVGQLIKTLSCEIKGSNIKYKNSLLMLKKEAR